MKKPKARAKQRNSNSAAAFFLLSITSLFALCIGSLLLLNKDHWIAQQELWLISRSAAISAYIALTFIVLLGIMLSHPRNKDTWRFTPKLLPWHQAAVGILCSLLALHLIFSLADSKSGVSIRVFWDPMGSQYHHWATLFGVIGFYLLLLIGITAGFRKWIKLWLPIHRLSWLLWAFVFFHGLYDGTDSVQFKSLYVITGGIIVCAFFWRHWTNNQRRARDRAQKAENLPARRAQ